MDARSGGLILHVNPLAVGSGDFVAMIPAGLIVTDNLYRQPAGEHP